MGTALQQIARPGAQAVETTLLELVRVISEVTDDDQEVVATVMEMLRSGRVRLCGTFCDSVLGAA